MRTPWLAFFTNKIIFSWSSCGVLEKLRKFKNATQTPSGVKGLKFLLKCDFFFLPNEFKVLFYMDLLLPL